MDEGNFMYRNIGLKRLEIANIDNFTSNAGIKLRRMFFPAFKQVLRLAVKRDIHFEGEYPALEKDKPYIFVSTHSFDEDIIASIASLDRNAYILMGTTDQIEHNPQMYAAWLNGMIYVDRTDKQNRHDAVSKMEKVINQGSSVLIFAEGGYNNSENLLCLEPFSSPWILSQKTGAQVVPLASFNSLNSNDIYIRFGKPIDLSIYDKKEARTVLRDQLASLVYPIMEEHAPRVKRSELGSDPRLDYMEERRQVYKKLKWTRDIWDEELTQYIPEEKRKPLILTDPEEKKYDFKVYMKKNWNK